MESCRTGGNPVGQESNVNILWFDIFMASHTAKQDNGSDRSCAVWLLCHSSLESISWSLSKLRPIYLTKSDNSSFSFHPRKESRDPEEKTPVSPGHRPFLGVIWRESLFKVQCEVVSLSRDFMLGFQGSTLCFYSRSSSLQSENQHELSALHINRDHALWTFGLGKYNIRWNFLPVVILTHIKLLQNSEYSPPSRIVISLPCKGRGNSKAARVPLTWSHPKLDRWWPKVVRFKYFIEELPLGIYFLPQYSYFFTHITGIYLTGLWLPTHMHSSRDFCTGNIPHNFVLLFFKEIKASR